MGGRGGSLRWRLLRTASAAAVLVIVLTGLIGYFMASQEAEELMDGHLAQEARLLMALTSSRDLNLADLRQRLEDADVGARATYEPKIEFQIGDDSGNILLRSEGAPRIPLMGAPGYSEIERAGVSWRIFNFKVPDMPYRVQVSQTLQIRERVAFEVATQVVWPLAIILPALILLLYYAVRRGLLPLEELAAEVGRFTPDSILPLSDERAPQEARPLVLAINRLLARLTVALEGERRFTADAAHELRTPLAALKVHSEVALASEAADVRDHAIRQVKHGVDRAGHLVEQLLSLARLDPLARLPSPRCFDLVECIRDQAAHYSSQGFTDNHELVFDLPQSVLPITGDPNLVGIVLRNLLDNAQRYSPAATQITVRLAAQADKVLLEVLDEGPGVPESARRHLTERFFRAAGAGAEGSGLGLAIVQRVVQLHSADLQITNRLGGGLQVRVVFPGKMP
jgi:two-component system sensor histidine kinase QseC